MWVSEAHGRVHGWSGKKKKWRRTLFQWLGGRSLAGKGTATHEKGGRRTRFGGILEKENNGNLMKAL